MKKAYITRAILKDYLTIKNVDITFNEDINIIIGKNGTGKTNFINYLADSLSENQAIKNNHSYIYFKSSNNNFLKEIKNIKFLKEVKNNGFFKNLSLKDNKVVNLKNGDGENLNEISTLDFIIPLKISHGIPESLKIIQEPINDVIRKIPEGYTVFPDTDSSLAFAIGVHYFTKLHSIIPKGTKSYNINESLNSLNNNLTKYSNIEGVRIGQNFGLDNSDKNEIYFNNLYLEYNINGVWLSFNQLSDGTKRLFYIISEITYNDRFIVLLEEPELGLHPHQLYDLMRFIKEASEKFQFIITTHSPMVLNTLNSDELDNIIISSIENGATQLKHLAPEQIAKAQAYMEKMDLSDYWIHSDLED
ncbi:hypothetical protein Q765_17730 [Flavobacterium rivuli WB 3.3-2 = DSM 21788]|uniref:ATPase AAA-type core domain-containing protein n=1 Tax=Flavobacterium rivuli WB 3.3-2 = DSM 21788 TaxID=1121895 RepID=A0A0A2LXW1_9FLAO|nr:ATP-binding protein [Flavobacterium rivuli]KGO85202.1 hypothetical protein Q765_17730 [Flavobacterium rivuli WB 3.3-2 = DSM 21788]